MCVCVCVNVYFGVLKVCVEEEVCVYVCMCVFV